MVTYDQESPRNGSRRGTWITLIVVGLFFSIGVCVWKVGPRYILPRLVLLISDDTEYAPGYSETAFRGIATGDSEKEVLAALGPPLSEEPARPYTTWLYSPSPQPTFAETGKPEPNTSYAVLFLDELGTFTLAHGQTLQDTDASGRTKVLGGSGGNSLGLARAEIAELRAAKATPQQLEAKFGAPRATYSSRTVRWLRYSRSPSSKNYYMRLIALDGNGKVSEKVAEIYWD